MAAPRLYSAYGFLLVDQSQNPQAAIATLNQSLAQLSHPLDLLLINFYSIPDPSLNDQLSHHGCVAASAKSVDGYRYRHL
jgi:hypothetical protein